MRKLASAAVASGLLLALAGCAGGPFGLGACTPTLASGGSAELVSAEGRFGQQPSIDFPTPLVSKEPRVEVLSAGDGPQVRPGDYVEFEVTVVNGTDGQVLTGSGYAEDSGIGRIVGTDLLSNIGECATVGSRLVATTPIIEVFGADAVAQSGFNPEHTVVVVYDVERAMPGRATGADQVPPSGLPAIVLAPNGEPGLTLPKADAPEDLRIAVLKQGGGEVVEAGDTIIAQYTGVIWESGRVFDSTWDANGIPRDLPAVSMADEASGVIPGFAEAIIGKQVGSQVIAVIPPEFGYPAGSSPSTIPEGSTLIFVIDILGIR